MSRATRKLVVSAWLIASGMLLAGCVSGGFCYAGFKQGDPMLWALGGVSFVLIAWAGIRALNGYWRGQ